MAGDSSNKPIESSGNVVLMMAIGVLVLLVLGLALINPAALLSGGVVTWAIVGLMISTGVLVALKLSS